MNIFYLNDDINTSCSLLDDKRVVKMCLETAQLLCTARNELGAKSPYKSFNPKHPCCIWAMESSRNWDWLKRYGLALCKEYSYRFNKKHKCESIIRSLVNPVKKNAGITKRPQCMDEIYKNKNAIQAYTNYYISEKINDNNKWTGRNESREYWELLI